MLRGGRLGLERKATVLAVAGQSQVVTFFAQALRATFPRHSAASQGVAQVVVDPDGTLESDEVPVSGGTNDGDMDATTADFRLLANASEEVTTMDEKKQTNRSGDVDGNTKRTTRHAQIAMTNPAPKPRLIPSTVLVECQKNLAEQSSVLVTKTETYIENKPISTPSRTKSNNSFKIGPCVKKARAPMNPKIACPCMRQLWELEPKRMWHTEPPSVRSSTKDMV